MSRRASAIWTLLGVVTDVANDGDWFRTILGVAQYGLPKGCRMRENSKIYAPENFECGGSAWIGEDVKLDATGGLSIGSYTAIGTGTSKAILMTLAFPMM